MRKEIGRIVKEYFSQTAADNNAENAIEKHVVKVLDRPSLMHDVWLFQPDPSEHDEKNKCQQIHKAIPVYGKRTDGDGDRIG